jgi:hypothetical protein
MISMRHSICICNSIVAAALIIMLERRLGNFPVFSLLFPLTLSSITVRVARLGGALIYYCALDFGESGMSG